MFFDVNILLALLDGSKQNNVKLNAHISFCTFFFLTKGCVSERNI